jgi:hypothetical protein
MLSGFSEISAAVIHRSASGLLAMMATARELGAEIKSLEPIARGIRV